MIKICFVICSNKTEKMKNFSKSILKGVSQVLIIFLVTNVFGQRKKQYVKTVSYENSIHESLKFREIGPFRGGRSAAVTGVKDNP